MNIDLTAYPYPSRRSAVLARGGIVATSQPLAAQAGIEVMHRGGNAVDAAVATAVALTIVEPTMNGIGGDAFALVWDGSRLHGLNGSGRWPGAQDAAPYRAQGLSELPERGWAGVTVPGAPAAWHDLHARFGCLDFAEVVGPAIRYAEQGFPVSPVVAGGWASEEAEITGFGDPALADWSTVFAPDGRAPRAGEVFRAPNHAACLKALVERGVRDFYEGGIAERIAAYAAETGGKLALDDLAAHRSEWVEPISATYRGHQVWEIPPNGQGIAALEALALLEGTDVANKAHLDGGGLHLQIEAMKLGFADAYRYVADPEHAPDRSAELLDPAYLDERRGLIGDTAGNPRSGKLPSGGTVYLCAADGDGLMVSYIQSNYHGFGSGVVVPDLGIALQNRACCFTLSEGHPNEAKPGRRPRHTIIPGFLTRDGQALGPFGVMGGEMQPQGHVQTVAGLLDHGLNPQATLDAPRWRVERTADDGWQVFVEPGMPEAAVAELRRRGHDVVVQENFADMGRGQMILWLADGVLAAGSEPRADGAAIGF